jgi:hypothetical protein
MSFIRLNGSYTLTVKPAWSEGVKDPLAQQLKSSAAISHPFDHLQLVDFPFHQAV